MAVGRRKRTARRIVALAFTLLILAQNALIPRSRANVVDVKLGQKKFVLWDYCDDLQKWGSKAGTDYTRIMIINEQNYFFNGTTSDYTTSGFVGFNCGYNVKNSDFSAQWQVANKEFFITEGGMNTPYIVYDQLFEKLHFWRLYLSDSQDRRTDNFLATDDAEHTRLKYRNTGGGWSSWLFMVPENRTKQAIVTYARQTYGPFPIALISKGTSWYLYDLKGLSLEGISKSLNETSLQTFLGREKVVDTITENFTVEYDQITVLGRKMEYVNPGVTITVKRGGVLTIEGALLNDGKIVVEEGGLLEIKSNAVIMPLFLDKSDRGGITSRGNIVIRSGGAMIGGGANGIYLSGGTVVNLGLMASENFTVKRDYTIEDRSGKRIYMGKTIDRTLVNRMFSDLLEGKLGNSFKVSDINENTLDNWLSNHTVDVTDNAIYYLTPPIPAPQIEGTPDDPIIQFYQQMPIFGGVPLFKARRSQITVTPGGFMAAPTITVSNSFRTEYKLEIGAEYYGTFDRGNGEEPLFGPVNGFVFGVGMLDNYKNK